MFAEPKTKAGAVGLVFGGASLVRGGGLEPPCFWAQASETCVSTSSTTRAVGKER